MYIIQEIQKSGDNVALLPPIQKTEISEAESTYYTIMAAAAISTVPVHTCIIYDEYGNNCTPGRRYYEHPTAP